MGKVKAKKNYSTGFGERISFGLFSFGAILSYYVIYSFLQLYLTDIGISAAVVGIIFIVAKIWDAVNDPIFGVIVDKGKRGKFLPWLRVAGFAVPLTTILLFAIPTTVSLQIKIIWAVVAYVLWDIAYTMYDVPLNSLITVSTGNLAERNMLFAICSFAVYVGGLFIAIAVPMLYPSIGWGMTGLIVGIFSLVTSVILPFVGKERIKEAPKEKEPTTGELISGVFKNKYLLILVLASIIGSMLDFSTTVQAYFALHCLGGAEFMTPLALATAVPVLFVAFIIPKVVQKVDKFRTYIVTRILTIVITVVIFLVGYSNFALLLILVVIRAICSSFWGLINIMMIADCVEYGCFKTGERSPGLAFSLKAFTNKIVVALAGALGMFALAAIGFIEGEGVVQTAETVKGIWFLYSLMPAIGGIIGVTILGFGYKLRDKQIKIMTACNHGEISREEADARLIGKEYIEVDTAGESVGE